MNALIAVAITLLVAATAAAQDVTVTDPLSGQVLTVPALPEPPETAHDAQTHAAIGFLMAAHAADLSTTMYVLGKCGGETGCAAKDGGRVHAREANPVLAPYSHNPVRFALLKFGLASAAVAGIYQLHNKHPKLARWLAYAEGAATFAIAFRNQQLLETTR